MTSTIHSFFDHPRAPARPAPTAVVIPLIHLQDVATEAQMAALEAMTGLYKAAQAGDTAARRALEIFKLCHREPGLVRLAGKMLTQLDRMTEAVSPPSDCEPGGAA